MVGRGDEGATAPPGRVDSHLCDRISEHFGVLERSVPPTALSCSSNVRGERMRDRANDATRVIVGRRVGRSLVQNLETEGLSVRRGGANYSRLT
jgi:hypothetical protein